MTFWFTVWNTLKALLGFGQAALGEVHDFEQRRAGAAESQLKAKTEDENRIADSAAAGDAAGRVFDQSPDPNDRSGKRP